MMTPPRSNPDELVMTQAEPVPGPDVTVPEPPASPPSATEGQGNLDPQFLLEIKALADRVGGLARLRDIVSTLLKFRQ